MCKKQKGLHNRIDPCIKHLIAYLNIQGINTIASCCGHGQYLVALDVNIANICKRLGHDMNTFLNSYCSADIFNDNDRLEIHKILGDLV